MFTCCRNTLYIRSCVATCAVTWFFARVLAVCRLINSPFCRVIVTELFNNAVFNSSALFAYSVLCTIFRASCGCICYPVAVCMLSAFCINSISLNHQIIFSAVGAIEPSVRRIICIEALAFICFEWVCKAVHTVAIFTVNSDRAGILSYFCYYCERFSLLHLYGSIELQRIITLVLDVAHCGNGGFCAWSGIACIL